MPPVIIQMSSVIIPMPFFACLRHLLAANGIIYTYIYIRGSISMVITFHISPPPFFPSSLSFAFSPLPPGSPLRMWPQSFFPMLYRICAKAQRAKLLSEIHSSPSGEFPYTYSLKLPMWRVVITIQYGKNRHTVY